MLHELPDADQLPEEDRPSLLLSLPLRNFTVYINENKSKNHLKFLKKNWRVI